MSNIHIDIIMVYVHSMLKVAVSVINSVLRRALAKNAIMDIVGEAMLGLVGTSAML